MGKEEKHPSTVFLGKDIILKKHLIDRSPPEFKQKEKNKIKIEVRHFGKTFYL